MKADSDAPDPSPTESPLRVAFQTYGCRSNYADSVDLQSALVERGATPCAIDSEADVYVVNTCTVTDTADREAKRLIRKLKQESPDAKIIVTGCMAEVGTEELSELLPREQIVGPGRRENVLAAIFDEKLSPKESSEALRVPDAHPSGRRVKKSLPERRSISLDHQMSEAIVGPGSSLGELRARSRFHLRVQEGCENSCTFCIIPQTRGRLSSRALADITSDIRTLYARGYREVVLSGTHLGGYGEDVGGGLLELLRICAEFEDGPRIRLSSIDPNDVSPEIIDIIAESDIFCPHLHICVQAFSDRVLKRMNRKYRMDEAREVLWYSSEKLPDGCIGSDLITGFPGESRQEVEEGIEEFLRLPISYLHVFPYSERSGTAATRLDGEVPPEERKRRAARWRAVAKRKHEAYLKSLVGRNMELVLEQVRGEHYLGTSAEYASLKIPVAAIDKNAAPGQILAVTGIEYDSSDETVLCQ